MELRRIGTIVKRMVVVIEGEGRLTIGSMARGFRAGKSQVFARNAPIRS